MASGSSGSRPIRSRLVRAGRSLPASTASSPTPPPVCADAATVAAAAATSRLVVTATEWRFEPPTVHVQIQVGEPVTLSVTNAGTHAHTLTGPARRQGWWSTIRFPHGAGDELSRSDEMEIAEVQKRGRRGQQILPTNRQDGKLACRCGSERRHHVHTSNQCREGAMPHPSISPSPPRHKLHCGYSTGKQSFCARRTCYPMRTATAGKRWGVGRWCRWSA
jgi:hypothetical protein